MIVSPAAGLGPLAAQFADFTPLAQAFQLFLPPFLKGGWGGFLYTPCRHWPRLKSRGRKTTISHREVSEKPARKNRKIIEK
jgi:hypothetical protein